MNMANYTHTQWSQGVRLKQVQVNNNDDRTLSRVYTKFNDYTKEYYYILLLVLRTTPFEFALLFPLILPCFSIGYKKGESMVPNLGEDYEPL